MYRKFTADQIFTGHEILSGEQVLITNESGTVIEIADHKDAGDGIEFFNGLLTPGFVNVHCHLELSHLKQVIAENTGLVEFVQQVMTGRASSAELKLEAMIRAEAEMYKAGTVAVGDICNTADSIPVKQKSKLLWHNFIEVSGFTDATAQKRLDDMRAVHEQFRMLGGGRNTSFSPHSPYSVSKKLFLLLNDETAGQVITIHNQESAAENDLYQNKTGGFLKLYKNFGIDIAGFEATGKSSFQSWLPYFTRGQSLISVHNTFTTADDLAFQQNSSDQLFYCICINANKYIEQNIPPIMLLKQNTGEITIGTDSLASNSQLNILEEIKTIQAETNHAVPMKELLQWATINGARALQLDNIVGSFEKGKMPGVVLIGGLDNLQTTGVSSSKRIL